MERKSVASFPLRMEQQMREKAQDEASRNRRSLNAELIVMIEEALNAREARKANA